MTIVVGDFRVSLVIYKFVAGVDVGAADDDDVEGSSALLFVEGPGGGAFGVSRGEVRGKGGAAERDGVAVVKNVVDFCPGKPMDLSLA